MIDALLAQIRAFIRERVIPAERDLLAVKFVHAKPSLEALRLEVKREGLWTPHLPTSLGGRGLTLPQFAHVSALLGESPLGHYLFNCQAPDIGNTELLHAHGTP